MAHQVLVRFSFCEEAPRLRGRYDPRSRAGSFFAFATSLGEHRDAFVRFT